MLSQKLLAKGQPKTRWEQVSITSPHSGQLLSSSVRIVFRSKLARDGRRCWTNSQVKTRTRGGAWLSQTNSKKGHCTPPKVRSLYSSTTRSLPWGAAQRTRERASGNVVQLTALRAARRRAL
jgi:hypothetical protein